MSIENRSILALFRFGNLIHNFNKRAEKEMGLSLAQWSVLKQLIDLPGTSAHHLAKTVGVHPSTLSQTLKRLEKKGFLFYFEDPKDSRRKQISITKSGKITLEEFELKTLSFSKELSIFENELNKMSSFLTEGSRLGSEFSL